MGGTSQPCLVDANEAARLLGMCRTSVFSLAAHGELRRVKFGHLTRFRLAEIEELAQRAAEGDHIRFGYSRLPA